MKFVSIRKSPNPDKKWRVKLLDEDGDMKTVDFGASGYTDYSMGATDKQRLAYISRHSRNEDWKKSGILTPGFWSRWYLWEKKSRPEALRNIINRFNL